jgi:inner membrane organizing system protein 1
MTLYHNIDLFHLLAYYVIDITLKHGLLPTGGGVVLGSVFSLLFFKRRRWPIVLGGGFGIGMAYSNCERDINATIRDRSI